MQIYISYSWKQPAKSIVKNWLCPILDQAFITYRIDEENCGYCQNIEKFEQEIGTADKVIAVIGKNYLYSIECMYELVRIIKHGNLKNRLIPVCLDDFERSLSEGQQIFQYWKNQEDKLMREIAKDANSRGLFEKELERIRLILAYMSEVWQYIRKTNTLTFENLSADNYKLLISYIKNESGFDEKCLGKIQIGVPVMRGEHTPTVNIIQHGAKSISQINHNSSITIKL